MPVVAALLHASRRMKSWDLLSRRELYGLEQLASLQQLDLSDNQARTTMSPRATPRLNVHAHRAFTFAPDRLSRLAHRFAAPAGVNGTQPRRQPHHLTPVSAASASHANRARSLRAALQRANEADE